MTISDKEAAARWPLGDEALSRAVDSTPARESRREGDPDDVPQPAHSPVDEPDGLERWHKLRPEPEPAPRERGLDTTPGQASTDWSAWHKWADDKIAAALVAERHAYYPILDRVVSDMWARAKAEFTTENAKLRAQVWRLEAKLAQLETKLAESTRAVDLPKLPSLRAVQ
jgi:hypothetical protein